MMTYLREMLYDNEKDIIIASSEINEGNTKRWIIAWKFVVVIDDSEDVNTDKSDEKVD